MSGSVLLHRQLSPEDLQQLLAWYTIRDTLFGENRTGRDIKKALELASVCEHPNAVWLTKLFARRDIAFCEEARQVFLGCENDPRALCFAGWFGGPSEEVRRAADLGDAFAQAWMVRQTADESFRLRKNLLLKENAMVSSTLVVTTEMEQNARKMQKELRRTIWLRLN
jgi:hypothetical protein